MPIHHIQKILKNLSEWLTCARTQGRSVRAGREECGCIVPPAAAAEVRQLKHLEREKLEGANTVPGKSHGSIYSGYSGQCTNRSLSLDTVLKKSLKIRLFPDDDRQHNLRGVLRRKSRKKLCQHRRSAGASQPCCPQYCGSCGGCQALAVLDLKSCVRATQSHGAPLLHQLRCLQGPLLQQPHSAGLSSHTGQIPSGSTGKQKPF